MSFETRPADWWSVERAVEHCLGSATPTEPVRRPLLESLGWALAEPVIAGATLPPWDNSAMDGYAVRSEDLEDQDLPVRLPVSGAVRAGVEPARLKPGTALRIMTGAPLPEGADSVVRVEDTDREETSAGLVTIEAFRDLRRNVRPAAGDMRAGDVVLSPGQTVDAGALAVAAAAGAHELTVHRKPRVAILSNGDELRGPDAFEEVARGRGIPESNGRMLWAATLQAGGTPDPPRIARDDETDIERSIEASEDADVLITSGGASMGEADLFKRVLDRLGFRLDFWRVTQRPGSPVSFGHLPRADRPPLPVFGLPGNPASAFVTFHVLARPFLRRMAGHARVRHPVVRAVAAQQMRSRRDLTHFLRVELERRGPHLEARLTGSQSSGLVQSLARADGLAVVPVGQEDVQRGKSVDVILLRPDAVVPPTASGDGEAVGG